MFKLALDKPELFPFLVILIDHKQFIVKVQGTCLGVLIMLCWTENRESKSITLLLDLIDCDPTVDDKSARATARKINELLKKHDLLKYADQTKYTGDYAVLQKLFHEFAGLGMGDYTGRKKVCLSHSGQCKFKRTYGDVEKRIQIEDHVGKLEKS